jgi:hypothetical protein
MATLLISRRARIKSSRWNFDVISNGPWSPGNKLLSWRRMVQTRGYWVITDKTNNFDNDANSKEQSFITSLQWSECNAFVPALAP